MEYLDPHELGSGAKLWELSVRSLPRALPYLLFQNESGDQIPQNESTENLGRWAGDEIVVVGDLEDSERYHRALHHYTEISSEIRSEINSFLPYSLALGEPLSSQRRSQASTDSSPEDWFGLEPEEVEREIGIPDEASPGFEPIRDAQDNLEKGLATMYKREAPREAAFEVKKARVFLNNVVKDIDWRIRHTFDPSLWIIEGPIDPSGRPTHQFRKSVPLSQVSPGIHELIEPAKKYYIRAKKRTLIDDVDQLTDEERKSLTEGECPADLIKRQNDDDEMIFFRHSKHTREFDSFSKAKKHAEEIGETESEELESKDSGVELSRVRLVVKLEDIPEDHLRDLTYKEYLLKSDFNSN
jgi:hypothetical protein